MKKQIIMFFAVAMAAICSQAVTWTDPNTGYRWTYTVANGAASVGGGSWSSTAIPTSTSGAIAIPSELGGYPVTSIGDYAFYHCSGLTSVTIPNSVTSIGDGAFYGCSGLRAVHIFDVAAWCGISFSDTYSNPLYYAETLYLSDEPVANLVIPDGVETIGYCAFYNCTNIVSVTIPDSVTSIGTYAFVGCCGLTCVAMPYRLNGQFGSNLDGISITYYIEIGDGLWPATVCDDPITLGAPLVPPSGEVVIPATIAGRPVTGVTSAAFAGNGALTGVTIPASVKSVEAGALGEVPVCVIVKDDAQDILVTLRGNVRKVVFAEG